MVKQEEEWLGCSGFSLHRKGGQMAGRGGQEFGKAFEKSTVKEVKRISVLILGGLGRKACPFF